MCRLGPVFLAAALAAVAAGLCRALRADLSRDEWIAHRFDRLTQTGRASPFKGVHVVKTLR